MLYKSTLGIGTKLCHLTQVSRRATSAGETPAAAGAAGAATEMSY